MGSFKNMIGFYTDKLKEGEILLLKSQDKYYKSHYNSSPLFDLTGFSGTSGEAIIEKNGKITLFVDTRYHILAQKQIFPHINLYKLDLRESFFDAFKKCYKKNTVLHLPFDILLFDYLKYSKYFDLRKYKLKKSLLKNVDINKKASIFLVDSEVEKHNFEYKIEKLKKSYPNVNKMLVFDLDVISYFTNLRCFQAKYSSNFRSVLFIDFKGENHTLFLDKIPKLKVDKLNFLKLTNFPDFIKSVDDEIYFDHRDISLEDFLMINKPKEIKRNNLPLIASIKPKSVIEDLNHSFCKLDLALESFRDKLKPGLSEYDLSQIFEEELLKNEAKGLSFKTILALDENSASIHYSTCDKNKILKSESLILIDCGGYWNNGYATDITRVFYFGLKPKAIYRKIYTNVLRAFINCFLSKETNASKLDELAREILSESEKDGFYFSHGLGHGIGTSVHQNPPLLSFLSDDTIKPYQTHSIEPGLYGKSVSTGDEFGIRIENCVYSDINYNKISLSKFPFEERLIDYSLLNKTETDFVRMWQEKTLWK